MPKYPDGALCRSGRFFVSEYSSVSEDTAARRLISSSLQGLSNLGIDKRRNRNRFRKIMSVAVECFLQSIFHQESRCSIMEPLTGLYLLLFGGRADDRRDIS